MLPSARFLSRPENKSSDYFVLIFFAATDVFSQ
jgi:hypothetical protein